MSIRIWHRINEQALNIEQIVSWAATFRYSCVLTSNNYTNDKYSSYELLVAAGAVENIKVDQTGNAINELEKFIQTNNDWVFGYLSYELKNEIENLVSENPDNTRFAALEFFVPRLIIVKDKEGYKAGVRKGSSEEYDLQNIIAGICAIPPESAHIPPVCLQQRLSRDEYISKLKFLKDNIQYGNIYEINFCHELYSEGEEINPPALFNRLNKKNPSPFAAFIRFDNHYALCSSPERWLCKRGDRLISQPIKGTAPRGSNAGADLASVEALRNSKKEQSENIMIVDLVRNDLSRIAADRSVRVEELMGVYTFPNVHQMISTVSCRIRPDAKLSEIIRATFPMGSMTGAPKIKAMQLIEETEVCRRGLYSGAIGYISPDGDFDFNVVIRTILYDSYRNYISVMAGGAITSASEAEDEYNESLLKMQALKRVLEQND